MHLLILKHQYYQKFYPSSTRFISDTESTPDEYISFARLTATSTSSITLASFLIIASGDEEIR